MNSFLNTAAQVAASVQDENTTLIFNVIRGVALALVAVGFWVAVKQSQQEE